MAQDIEKECITLKSICKKFNFVDELNILVTQLKQEPQMIQCLQTRQTADIFIENIEYIIRKLNDIDQKEKKVHFLSSVSLPQYCNARHIVAKKKFQHFQDIMKYILE